MVVDNESGVLARVIGLFSGRGYNIDSLTVAEVDHEGHLSRITVVTRGTPPVIAQIKAQLRTVANADRIARAERLKLDGRGVRISSVAEDGPARDKLAAGSDIVLEVLYPTPRRAVKTVADLQGVLFFLKDGDYVSLLVRNIDPRVGDRVVNIRVGG